METTFSHPLFNWIPYKLIEREDGIYFEWIYVGTIKFIDPFFDETISKCKSHPYYSGGYKIISSLACLLEWSGQVTTLELQAFIFHISRCGSTMVSQLLSIPEQNVVISEAPVFDEILRNDTLTAKQKAILLKATIKLLGQKRETQQKYLIIKLDSWHLLKLTQLREEFPELPFFILYRNPAEVLTSHHLLSGMHMVPNVLPPATFGFLQQETDLMSFEQYRVNVLKKYFNAILEFIKIDELTTIFDYRDGMQPIVDAFIRILKINYPANEREKMRVRLKTHSKHPTDVFTGDKQACITPDSETIHHLYLGLQKENAQ